MTMRRTQKALVQGKPLLNDFGFNIIQQGIYCLFCEDDKTYVGQSCRIERRLLEHETKKPERCYVLEIIDDLHNIRYDKVISIDKVLDTCEALWMAILDPELNIQRPKLNITSRGEVSGYCINPGQHYQKPSQQLMRQVASALRWSLEEQNHSTTHHSP